MNVTTTTKNDREVFCIYLGEIEGKNSTNSPGQKMTPQLGSRMRLPANKRTEGSRQVSPDPWSPLGRYWMKNCAVRLLISRRSDQGTESVTLRRVKSF
jgi:hypothetical protein